MACTKATIIEKVSEKLHPPTHDATKIVETMLEIIKSTLASGEDIMITGFGKFLVNEKSQRKGRNPATGENMVLGKRRVVTFKCAGKLRDRINKKPNP